MRFVLAHGETAAAIMAAAHGLLTGRPTAVVVTRGPGATSVANGTAQASLDRYPLITITDTVPSGQRHRVAHQRIDQRALFEPITKLSATVSCATPPGELDRLVAASHAWPYGAVHLDYDASGPSDVPAPVPAGAPADDGATVEAMAKARRLLSGAGRPVVIAGMEAAVIGEPVRDALVGFGCPVLTTYQAVGLVPTEGPLHAGLFTNGAIERPVLDAADLIVTVGLDDVEPIPAPWACAAPVVRISAAAQNGGYLPATVELTGDVAGLAGSLLEGPHGWAAGEAVSFRRAARALIRSCEPGSGSLGPVAVVDAAIATVPAGATVTVDAGAHFLAIMPLWPVGTPFELLISNGLATMGFALPAAIGAAIARPGRPAVALVGDGGLAMTMAELETLARLDLAVTVIVFNDAALSLIEIKQGESHGGAGAVRFGEIDFAAAARACGIDGSVVESPRDLRAVLAGRWDRPRLIDARVDPSSYPDLIATTRG
jgi:acetolactate synthase-1/2/3 large subunit